MDAWQQLKTRPPPRWRSGRAANPDKALDEAPFWMTGESWGHGVMQSDYYRHGFDAMINFDYQDQAAKAVDLSGRYGFHLAANGGKAAKF